MLKEKRNTSYKSYFFKDDNLPFVESRYVVDSPLHYEKHFHTTLSVGAIEKGMASYVHGNDQDILTPGQLSIIEPEVVHYCNPIEGETRTYHMIYVDIEWCEALQENLFEDIEGFIPLQLVQVEDEELFLEYIQLNKVLLDKNIFYLQKEEVLESFFLKLFERYCVGVDKKNIVDNKNDIQKVYKAKNFIKSYCLENITLDEIAKYSGISKFYLSKLFQKIFYISPHRYLLNCKINIAKKLLSQGYETAEVAHRTGFFDQSHFGSVFKKYVAATPNEYKMSILI
jgi:AraC-like DNA-binding protein